ncbi:MAG TPA: hypothetical protein DCK95_06815 [Anaerolineaceae bacterium]|nr:hypothetical protein [Anaerolineaceae bacterium]
MIIGIDLSEKNNVSSWSDIAKNHVRFAYLKCTDGVSVKVDSYSENHHNAKKYGILTGAYHWLNPAQDADAQVQHFLQSAAVADDDLPPVICLELYTTSSAVLEAKLRTMLESLEQGCGKRPIIYTSRTYWRKYLATTTWPSEYPLWIDEPSADWPAQLYPWIGWVLWQFSYQSKIPGVSGMVGSNWFNGNVTELKYLAKEGSLKR